MKKVLLTGASGFIGKHIVRELLAQGFAVRATVRNEAREGEIRNLFPDAQIEFAHLDLTKDEGWDAALAGVDVLMHTASPFPSEEPKDPEVLIRPAVDGTLRALNAAKAAGVNRVILTSSTVAIYGGADNDGSRELTEADWSGSDAFDVIGAYGVSKTRAERAAWDFVAQNPEMVLTTVNPGAVFGPAMDSRYGTSLRLVEMAMTGKLPMQPDITFPVVDVRDVARMHVAAIDNEATYGERFAAGVEGGFHMMDIVASVAEIAPDSKAKPRNAPNWLVNMLALVNKEMKLVKPLLTRRLYVSTAKTKAAYGVDYIDRRKTIEDTVAFLQENGVR